MTPDVKTVPRRYKVGMYGGKFCPMHKGHEACLIQALRMCDAVDLVLVIGGEEDEKIRREMDKLLCDYRLYNLVQIESRVDQLYRVAMKYQRLGCDVRPVVVNVLSCRDKDGHEDWDKETPLILAGCRHFDAVFGSEESYRPYFNRAYPWADYICIDEKREMVPISATQIRGMSYEEAKEWIV